MFHIIEHLARPHIRNSDVICFDKSSISLYTLNLIRVFTKHHFKCSKYELFYIFISKKETKKIPNIIRRGKWWSLVLGAADEFSDRT